MSVIATAVKHLIAAGVTGEALVTAIAEMEKAMQPARSSGAERTARWRSKKESERHSDVTTVTGDADPSPLVPPFPPAPPNPPIIPPTRSDRLNAHELETKLRDAAGWQNEPHPNLFVVGCIETLLANGADLEADVLPVIRGRARSVRRPSGWAYFVGPIQDAMQARLGAATGPPRAGEVVPFTPATRSHHASRPTTIAAGFDLIDRAIEQRERELAAAEAWEGRGQGDPLALS